MSRLEFFGVCVWLLALTDAITVTSSANLECPEGCRCIRRGEGSVTACIKQNLTYIPLGIPDITEELYLKENQLRTLRQGSFAGLSQLRTLVMTKCNIERIDSNAFSGLRSLWMLDLRWNKIKELQSYTFSGLFQLNRLILDSNDIQIIHNFAFHGLNLTQLSLEKNPNLAEIAQKAFYGAKINKLFIYNATVSAKSTRSLIPLSASLHELKWQNNRVALEFPTNLFQGFTFRSLHLDNNGITHPGFLTHVYADEISLVGNRIGPVDFSHIQSMRRVRQLHLSSTRFSYIRGSFFKGLTHLTHLFLDDNGITMLPDDLKFTFQRLRRLSIAGNPLHCNCELLWLKLWLSSTTVTVLGAHCATPQPVSLLSVPEESFRCKPPIMLNISRSVNISEENDLTLKCRATGDPPPALIWHRPTGQRSVTGYPPNRTVKMNIGVLRVNPVQPEDAGIYRCVARNPSGTVSRNVTVDVYRVYRSVSLGLQVAFHMSLISVVVVGLGWQHLLT